MRVKTALAPKKLISIAQMKPKAQKICLQSDLRAHLVSVLFKFSFSLRNINKKKVNDKIGKYGNIWDICSLCSRNIILSRYYYDHYFIIFQYNLHFPNIP